MEEELFTSEEVAEYITATEKLVLKHTAEVVQKHLKSEIVSENFVENLTKEITDCACLGISKDIIARIKKQ